MSAEEEMLAGLRAIDPDVADAAMLRYVFVKVCQVCADTEILLATMAALCAKVGFTKDEMLAITSKLQDRS